MGIVITSETGVVTKEETRRHVQELLSDPLIPKPVHEIVDKREVDQLSSTLQEALYLAESMESAPNEGIARIAYLVADDWTYGIARQMQTLLEGRVEVGVFRDPAEACEWIGLAADALNGSPSSA